jgi:hypothetical protein
MVRTAFCTILVDGGGYYKPNQRTKPTASTIRLKGAAAAQAANLTAYFNGSGYSLAPKGGACTGNLGANGSSAFAIVNRSDPNVRVDTSFTVTYGDILDTVCPIDAKARSLLASDYGSPCPAPDRGVKLALTGHGAFSVRVAAGSPSAWWHGRSRYQAIGAGAYDVDQSGTSVPFLSTTVCAMPAAQAATCRAALGG